MPIGGQEGFVVQPDHSICLVLLTNIMRFHAVPDAWATQGHVAISTRSLAQAAALPISSLHHHFGTLEHLFLEALADARECRGKSS